MAGRIRSIKPELLEDDKVADLPDRAWRLFVSLWLVADDYGNFRAPAAYLKGAIFWGSEDVTVDDVQAALRRLESDDFVRLYRVRGQLYGHVSGWGKHQKVDKPGKPRVPSEHDPEAIPERQCFTYLIQLGENGPIKIGRTIDVEARTKRLQTLAPDKLFTRLLIPGNEEAALHKQFAKFRKEGEWFQPAKELLDYIENRSRMIRESGAPDLRPPTSDLDHDRPGGAGADDEEPKPAAPSPPPPPESVEPSEPPPSESGFDLAKRIFAELWQVHYREPYQFTFDLSQQGDDRVLQRIGHIAIDSATAAISAEAILRHKIGGYLRDGGRWVTESRHPARGIEKDWNKYGMPRAPASVTRIAKVKPAEELPPPMSEEQRERLRARALGIGSVAPKKESTG